jgi:serine/threonine protein kinase
MYAKQGIVRNMKVAIKKLSRIDDFSEKQFEDELNCLKRVKHKNIVRFLGYCSDTQKEVVVYKGAYVLAECRKRFLCFEYAPNRSLEDYIKGMYATTCLGVVFYSHVYYSELLNMPRLFLDC